MTGQKPRRSIKIFLLASLFLGLGLWQILLIAEFAQKGQAFRQERADLLARLAQAQAYRPYVENHRMELDYLSADRRTQDQSSGALSGLLGSLKTAALETGISLDVIHPREAKLVKGKVRYLVTPMDLFVTGSEESLLLFLNRLTQEFFLSRLVKVSITADIKEKKKVRAQIALEKYNLV